MSRGQENVRNPLKNGGSYDMIIQYPIMEGKMSMRIPKTMTIALGAVLAVLALIAGLLLKIALTTPQMFQKSCYFICVLLISLLIVLLGCYLWLSRDKEKNYFLLDRSTGKNISPEQLRFSAVNEKMATYIAANFENTEKLWLGNAWFEGGRFGANGEYRGLVAYKMLYDLADHDQNDEWSCFVNASAETVSEICSVLAHSGDRTLAQKLLYVRQNCGAEIAPLRSLLIGNKKYLANKMLGMVRRNIEWFYYD